MQRRERLMLPGRLRSRAPLRPNHRAAVSWPCSPASCRAGCPRGQPIATPGTANAPRQVAELGAHEAQPSQRRELATAPRPAADLVSWETQPLQRRELSSGCFDHTPYPGPRPRPPRVDSVSGHNGSYLGQSPGTRILSGSAHSGPKGMLSHSKGAPASCRAGVRGGPSFPTPEAGPGPPASC